MSRKAALAALADEMITSVNRAGNELPVAALDGPGSWEVWNCADAVSHCSAWLEQDLDRLKSPGQVIPIIESDELEQTNRKIYEKYQKLPWVKAKEMLVQITADISREVKSMTEAELDQTGSYSDGRTRPLWWGMAGHLGLHVAWHLGIVLRRHDLEELSVSITEDVVARSAALSDNPMWLAANHYDLAAAYAQTEHPEEAMQELEESFRHNPGLREFASEDDDLQNLRYRDDFRELAGG
ncbi:TPR end-of-group domain-containing protein [Salinispira pacifica]|uniref:DinB-like domain-containing protein n=1 Tax=Salinispira pacifica TaxID=1307761 RepID=V5WEA1_9SPIO|nr:ClbS/DfsB family four-helix bundle protein [Salinispira pacifica]AHC14122.1 hypothetical protein L21SP2_0695 [Salinispira pacifica]